MTGFCVIISGRLPGDKNDTSVWAPVRTGFKLDEATFNQRVLAALPLLVRQNLDEAAAEHLTQQLRASGVDACLQSDDAQLAYFERAGTVRGPVPLSALGMFIRPDERYRLRGGQEWQTWTGAEPALDLSLPEAFEHMPEVLLEKKAPPPLPHDAESSPPSFLTSNAALLANSSAEVSVATEKFLPSLPQDAVPRNLFTAPMTKPPNRVIIGAVITALIVYGGSSLFSQSDTSKVSGIYASTPDSKDSSDKIISFASGIWTTLPKGDLWRRYDISSDGKFTEQSALPTQSEWGTIEQRGNILPATGKFMADGKRWFGFYLLADGSDGIFSKGDKIGQFIIYPDGRLVEIDGAGNGTYILNHEDANPFSK